MKSPVSIAVLITLSLTGLSYADESVSSESWQMRRLLNPTPAELAGEKKGRVMIYDGLTDKTVDKALDENFDRIGALMFTRTVVTDEAGNPLRDPDTGEIVIEEDGCD